MVGMPCSRRCVARVAGISREMRQRQSLIVSVPARCRGTTLPVSVESGFVLHASRLGASVETADMRATVRGHAITVVWLDEAKTKYFARIGDHGFWIRWDLSDWYAHENLTFNLQEDFWPVILFLEAQMWEESGAEREETLSPRGGRAECTQRLH